VKQVCNNQGSTLIETLISMVIVGITTLGGMALYFNAAELKFMAVHKKMAIELVNSKLEEYRALNCSELTTNITTVVELNESDDHIELIAVLEEVVDTTNCTVEVSVNWNEVGQNQRNLKVKFITYVRDTS